MRITRSGKFKRDYKLAQRQQKDLEVFKAVIAKLLSGKGLPRECQDHKLSGDLKEYRELHLAPDWLLIYRIDKSKNELKLARLGSHSQLYK